MRGQTLVYKNWEIPFRISGSNYKKDTLHIDGDDNLLTAFYARLPIQIGDTLIVKFDGFLRDEENREYKLDPIQLIVESYVKPK